MATVAQVSDVTQGPLLILTAPPFGNLSSGVNKKVSIWFLVRLSSLQKTVLMELNNKYDY